MSRFARGLPATQVHSHLQGALTELRRAEKNAVLWFAEIQTRKLYRELGYASIHQYATEALGFSRGKTSQFVHLASSLGRLPALKKSLAAGELPWTKAREVAKVATRRNEKRWIAEAQQSNSRQLEQRVAASRARARQRAAANTGQGELAVVSAAGHAPSSGTPSSHAASPRAASWPPAAARVGVSLQFTSDQLARFEILLERLRKMASPKSAVVPRLSRREELILAGLEELLCLAEQQRGAVHEEAEGKHVTNAESIGKGVQSAGEFPRGNSAPRYQIVVTQCESCGQGQVPTSRGPKPLPPATLEAISCDARILKPRQRNKASIAPSVRRKVMAQDGHRCQMPGCGQARFLEVHHKVPRAAGGTNKADNLITLCERCHRFLHEWAAQRRWRSPCRELW